MGIVAAIQSAVHQQIKLLYQTDFPAASALVNETKPEFEGDYTVVLFALVKPLKKSPEGLGQELGAQLVAAHPELFSAFNVIKGFLNLSIAETYWLQFLDQHAANAQFGYHPANGQKVMVEYSSPNTNKPLHLGHLRNNFLGWSIAEIAKANGFDVVKTCIVNDRGVHICKSMLAWQRLGNGATPESTGIKGDHFVGDYYVKFENLLKEQTAPILEKFSKNDTSDVDASELPKLTAILNKLPELSGDKKKEAEDEIKEIARNSTEAMRAVRQMLIKWEQGDLETMALWEKMNSWVYEGFNATYKRIGSDFDKTYYESNTYLLGKELVESGLQKGVFYAKEDGSVWIDLTADGLDEKIVRRKDGTSVYITQDIGLAVQKYEEYKSDQSIYVVGDEQNYHFKVLKLIAQKLQLPSADGIYHLSYGMVELPSGKMKSREGTVVDADDLIAEMVKISAAKTEELGKVKDFNEAELAELYDTLGLGALKFFLLRVDPKKKMLFNPEESIEFQGFTGPFIQYTHARIKSILRKEESGITGSAVNSGQLFPLEKSVITLAEQFPAIIAQANAEHNPSVIANYIFRVAQTFNSFYTEHSVMNAESAEKKQLRLKLAAITSQIIATGMKLLGIKVPERM
ncbi:arginine--tRNA ligase [Pseudobacter ginsenosidimutans]|uniref:Arginine--tRNA ligase n=1 Tax=Pseudobacter ginsenosidimutans TaxID=661488 RepID=A0A4Q7N5X2_9BACT|nr:arginine--tRNA ligase [Pseudobacter ginsenosidimutans]QEC44967.1 arginine--tRNA ligase [Pseudobacter ginsenosidimutans]RZS76462.1 arginyl-tRNA synthetase [Pseudobacter ginsenosidimutans]